MKTNHILVLVLCTFCASIIACTPSSNEPKNQPNLDLSKVVKNQQELRYVIEELLKDTALFQDTSYFANKVFPVIEHNREAKEQDQNLVPLTANDSLILASSNQLYREYEALLKQDFKAIFTAYRDSSYKEYLQLKAKTYEAFIKSDDYSRENFNRYARNYGFEFTLLQPISIN